MTNMENMDRLLAERERQQEIYDRAMASIKLQRQYREGEGLTLMFAWDAFGEEVTGDGLFAKAGKAAQMFCIGFAFLAPSLLLIQQVF
ncbi:MAG: hypothetical protein AB8B71_02360 [Paracoccaceae bacterium]